LKCKDNLIRYFRQYLFKRNFATKAQRRKVFFHADLKDLSRF
jgi:hypothetical protein